MATTPSPITGIAYVCKCLRLGDKADTISSVGFIHGEVGSSYLLVSEIEYEGQMVLKAPYSLRLFRLPEYFNDPFDHRLPSLHRPAIPWRAYSPGVAQS